MFSLTINKWSTIKVHPEDIHAKKTLVRVWKVRWSFSRGCVFA